MHSSPHHFFPTVLEVQFQSSTYRVSKSEGSVEICLERVGSAVIAPGVKINLILVEVSEKHLGRIQ